MGNPFSGRVYVVTGASKGIGRCLTLKLIERGAVVHGVARSLSILEDMRRGLRDSFTYTSCDLSISECVDRVVDDVLRIHGVPYGLVNNAGAGALGNPFKLGYEVFERMTKLLYLAPVKLSLRFGELMAGRGEGVIVNVITLGICIHVRGLEAYLAPKHALHRFTKDLRDYLRGSGVKVISVYPSATRTDFFKGLGLEDAFKHASSNPVLSKLILKPEAVADSIIKAIEGGAEVVAIPKILRLALIGK